ncbi:MAG: polysaccharide deacetylase family protein [Cyanobacteriota bacterium]|nr:polysaccharide deacetylase family protein [Cyanobacteriota bacterium]
MTTILAFSLGLGLALLTFKITTVEIPVFGFHDIIDLDNPAEQLPQRSPQAGDYSKQNLSVFLNYLVKQNYWFLSTSDLYDYFLNDPKKPIPEAHKSQKPILLTFDDGYKSAHRNILSILEAIERQEGQKIKIVWFINPAFLGIRGSQLDRVDCTDLREGVKRGYYDVQSHGLNHLNLTQIDDEKRDRELLESRKQLKACLGDLDARFASHIAYPFGASNSRVRQHVSRYYLTGYLYNSRILRPSRLKSKYSIPRLSVDDKMSVARLKILAAGFWF